MMCPRPMPPSSTSAAEEDSGAAASQHGHRPSSSTPARAERLELRILCVCAAMQWFGATIVRRIDGELRPLLPPPTGPTERDYLYTEGG